MLTTGLFTTRYTVNRFLPFALLLLNMSLPPFVAILARKPCVLFLLRFDTHFKVFFMIDTLQRCIVKVVFKT
jgi:hypothetical protein